MTTQRKPARGRVTKEGRTHPWKAHGPSAKQLREDTRRANRIVPSHATAGIAR